MVLLILGSYQDESITRLRNLKQRMMGSGWDRCYLVEDFEAPRMRDGEDEDAHLTRKSLYWIERSDACIFVFNAGANNESVGYELKHASDHLPAKLDTTLVAVDTSGQYASTLVRGHIQKLRNERVTHLATFHDDETLFQASITAALSFIRTLTPVLDIRSDPTY
ncbi:MAG: hypothetical protein WC941_10230 [Candidatus Bathyarchaeia archaeon]